MNIRKYLFFDIESHRVKSWSQLSDDIQEAFIHHYYDENSYDSPELHYNEIAGLHAEFSQVICVCFGYEDEYGQYRKLSICEPDWNEVTILKKCALIFKRFQDAGYALAGHNINACDCPYLMKRYIINRMKVPEAINHTGKKPWEIEDLDTMQLWKFGSWTNVSLEMICASLGINCKSEEVSGANLYTYDINDVPQDELVKYCEEDVYSNYLMTKEIFKYI